MWFVVVTFIQMTHYPAQSFSPDSELLISVGNNASAPKVPPKTMSSPILLQHDKQVLVWDWRKRRRLAESRLTCQVNAMAQAESGRMFVTVSGAGD